MNAAIKARWVAALRSGEYQQTGKALHRLAGDDPPPGYCCLGVLCDLAAKDGIVSEFVEGSCVGLFDGENGRLPYSVVKWAGLDSSDPYVRDDDCELSLAAWNDEGATFTEIADIIEEQL